MTDLAGTVREVASAQGVLAPDDRLAALDSLAMVVLVTALEEALGIGLFQAHFRYKDFLSVATVVELIARAGGAQASNTVPPPKIDNEPKRARDDDDAKRAVAELVRSLSDAEVAAQLADWSTVALELPASVDSSELSGARRDLFVRLVAQHHLDVDDGKPLARRAATTVDATFTQRRMWNMHELGDFRRLGFAHAFPIRGPLDADAMRQAFAALVVRHAALRSVFALDGSRLIQTVGDRGPELDVFDLSMSADGERMTRARKLFDAIALPHDLGRQPFRAQLVRLGEGEHLFLLAAHHIVCDGVSHHAMWRDLSALYEAAVAGVAADLPALDFQFTDFSFWQNTLAQRPLGNRQLAFWDNVVSGYEDVEVPGDLPGARRTALRLDPSGGTPIAIEGKTWDALMTLCLRLKVPPSSVIATAFFLFVTRCADRSELMVWGGSHLRRRPGSERVMGPFVTPYPLRLVIDDRTTLGDAVLAYHHAALANHQQHGIGPTPALARWPELIRYNLNYQVSADEAPVTFGSAVLHKFIWNPEVPYTVHDLAMYVSQGASGVRGTLVHNAARFSPGFASRLAAYLHSLAGTLATEPTGRVNSLPRF